QPENAPPRAVGPRLPNEVAGPGQLDSLSEEHATFRVASQIHPRQVTERHVGGKQHGVPLVAAHSGEILDGVHRKPTEGIHAQAAQLLYVPEGAQTRGDVLCERANVRALRAMDLELEHLATVCDALQVAKDDATGSTIDRDSAPSQLIKTFPFELEGRMHGRDLRLLSLKPLQNPIDILHRQRWDRRALDDRRLTIARFRACAKPHPHAVSLTSAQQSAAHLGGLAEGHWQHA